MKPLKQQALVLFSILLFGLSFINCWSQSYSYGGSAYAYVKDSKNNRTRVINVTTGCDENSKSSAKFELESSIKRRVFSGENLTSHIYYDIDECYDNDNNEYGGSASVTVKDTNNGKSRVINVTTGCFENTESWAKIELETMIKRRVYSGEIIASKIYYDIDSCQGRNSSNNNSYKSNSSNSKGSNSSNNKSNGFKSSDYENINLRDYPEMKIRYPISKQIIEESDKQVSLGKPSINETIDYIVKQFIASPEFKDKHINPENSDMELRQKREVIDFTIKETEINYTVQWKREAYSSGKKHDKWPHVKEVNLITYDLINLDKNSLKILKFESSKIELNDKQWNYKITTDEVYALWAECKTRNCAKTESISVKGRDPINKRSSDVILGLGYQNELLKLKRTYDHLFKMINPSQSTSIINSSNEDFWGKSKKKKN